MQTKHHMSRLGDQDQTIYNDIIALLSKWRIPDLMSIAGHESSPGTSNPWRTLRAKSYGSRSLRNGGLTCGKTDRWNINQRMEHR